MNNFKYRQFEEEIFIQCIRWYCKYGISYREQEEMMLERGIDVYHTTIYLWVKRFAPEIERCVGFCKEERQAPIE
ncbi:IS6 family transposase [Cytophagales bacterium RKSG123]|nr:IS6 family transposase [Xanthovirga aplysinae]